jgi:hypothetical protein
MVFLVDLYGADSAVCNICMTYADGTAEQVHGEFNRGNVTRVSPGIVDSLRQSVYGLWNVASQGSQSQSFS